MHIKIYLLSLFMAIFPVEMKAQIYGQDEAVQYPVMNYPSIGETSEMAYYAQMRARLEYLREENFREYSRLANISFNRGDYSGCLYYSEKALKTTYYTADLYYIRGVSYEKLQLYKEAKKEYRRAKRKGSTYAISALRDLKEKTKKRK